MSVVSKEKSARLVLGQGGPGGIAERTLLPGLRSKYLLVDDSYGLFSPKFMLKFGP